MWQITVFWRLSITNSNTLFPVAEISHEVKTDLHLWRPEFLRLPAGFRKPFQLAETRGFADHFLKISRSYTSGNLNYSNFPCAEQSGQLWCLAPYTIPLSVHLTCALLAVRLVFVGTLHVFETRACSKTSRTNNGRPLSPFQPSLGDANAWLAQPRDLSQFSTPLSRVTLFPPSLGDAGLFPPSLGDACFFPPFLGDAYVVPTQPIVAHRGTWACRDYGDGVTSISVYMAMASPHICITPMHRCPIWTACLPPIFYCVLSQCEG